MDTRAEGLAVVGNAGHDKVLRLGSTTEKLNTVILVHVNLKKVDDRIATNALESDSVKLVVRTDDCSRELDSNVSDDSAIVVRIVAAVPAGSTFTESLAVNSLLTAGIERSPSVDDYSTPVTALPAADLLR